MQLYSTKAVLNSATELALKSASPTTFYSKVGEGKYSTIVIDGAGRSEEQEIDTNRPATCASTHWCDRETLGPRLRGLGAV